MVILDSQFEPLTLCLDVTTIRYQGAPVPRLSSLAVLALCVHGMPLSQFNHKANWISSIGLSFCFISGCLFLALSHSQGLCATCSKRLLETDAVLFKWQLMSQSEHKHFSKVKVKYTHLWENKFIWTHTLQIFIVFNCFSYKEQNNFISSQSSDSNKNIIFKKEVCDFSSRFCKLIVGVDYCPVLVKQL